jgi:hypothetical protein
MTDARKIELWKILAEVAKNIQLTGQSDRLRSTVSLAV